MKHVSKKGFTLTEMMIVIAIIVIIVGAVAAGIAIDINRYNSFLDGQKAKYADGDDYMNDDSLWEAQARREVHNIYDSAQSANAVTMASNSAAAAESEAAAAAASASYAAAHPSVAAESSAAATSSAAAKITQAAKTTQASSGGGGGGNVDVSRYSNISSANFPAGFTISDVYNNNDNGGLTYKLTTDMTDCNGVTATVNCSGNTFTRGWGGNNDFVISNGGHTISYVIPLNPYWKDPFKDGGTMGVNWQFANQGNTEVSVTITVN